MIVKVIQSVRKTIKAEVVKEVEVDLPTESKFFRWNDDGAFFARGVVLFAIIWKYKNTYQVMQVERNKQDCNDFIPLSDCKDDYFLKPSSYLRKLAYDILMKNNMEFEEIPEEQFLKERTELLDLTITEYITKKQE